MSAVCWYDNRVVSLLSTFVSSEPVNESNKDNKQIKIPCPAVVQVSGFRFHGFRNADCVFEIFQCRVFGIGSFKYIRTVFFC
jgi:hypothetical protein